jgi:predicted RNA-binding protein with PIN domain
MTNYRKDERRKHHHYQVTIYYTDGEQFARTYTDRGKAKNFAARQKKSPVVKRTRVAQMS